ncbi:unnamed protein product [Paramecium sonneborni]|uniref:Uncharacterized protein n=1 Tax=Paramecium sonneborni TaxID=65129 RepID=A0A8S1LEK0_9CILI|nr:unnamed protein product [Paramecium sonneborni]
MIKPQKFDVVAILDNLKKKLQTVQFREDQNMDLLEKLKILAQVLFNSQKSEILKLIESFTKNSSENKQIFEQFTTSSCSKWFMEQLYIDQVQIILQQYLKNNQQFIGVFLQKIMNLYQLDLQVQNLSKENLGQLEIIQQEKNIQNQVEQNLVQNNQNYDISYQNLIQKEQNICQDKNQNKMNDLAGSDEQKESNYLIPQNEQSEITINQYTSLEGVYELLENKYAFYSWWPEFQKECHKCKSKEEFSSFLFRKAPILMERWTKIAGQVDTDQFNTFDDFSEIKQFNEEYEIYQLDNNNLEQAPIIENNSKISCEINDLQQEITNEFKNDIQTQNQGNQTESNQAQNSQLTKRKEFIQEKKFSQDVSEIGPIDLNQEEILENQDYFNPEFISLSQKSSANICSNNEDQIFDKEIEDNNYSNQSQSDSVILNENQTKKSFITNLEQFYKSKLVENQPQHIIPELGYMGDTKKMVEKLLFFLDFEKLDIQIEDFLTQPQINPSKMLQDFILTTYNIIKYITVHKYSTIIEVKQVGKEYLGQVIICQVNNKNQEIKKYKGPCLNVVNIVTRLIAIKKLNNKFFSEGLECVNLFSIVMSIIKRLIPGRGLFKEISEKYKKVQRPTDKQLDKIVIIQKTPKSNQEFNQNAIINKPEAQKKNHNQKKQENINRKYQEKKYAQRDQYSRKNYDNNQGNKNYNFKNSGQQNDSYEFLQQNQNNQVEQEYFANSFNKSPKFQYQSNYQGQLQNQLYEQSYNQNILNNQNQYSLQGYQGRSNNSQQQSNYYQQQNFNQQSLNLHYYPPIPIQNMYNNQNDYQMQKYPYYMNKSQSIQKGNFNLGQHSQQSQRRIQINKIILTKIDK